MDKEEYLSTRSDYPLRVTCYGSSSSATPVEYLAEAEALGRTLALRGHTCVNGAGSAGCMAAMNDGASAEGGDIVGVIHEMFVVDGQDWGLTGPTEMGGAHAAFHGGKRTILVASGNDLRERKRLLVENADALVVLPGGPGTFDELWEMVCAKNLAFNDMPIVCVNVNGYYEPFREMLDRAYSDKLLRNKPETILHFEPTHFTAVKWIEKITKEKKEEKAAVAAVSKEGRRGAYRRADSALTVDRLGAGRGSFLSTLRSSFRRDTSDETPRRKSQTWKGGMLVEEEDDDSGAGPWKQYSTMLPLLSALSLGVAIGASAAAAATRSSSSRSL